MYFPGNTSNLLVLARHCNKGAILASSFPTAVVMAASLNGSSSSSLMGITTNPKQMGINKESIVLYFSPIGLNAC